MRVLLLVWLSAPLAQAAEITVTTDAPVRDAGACGVLDIADLPGPDGVTGLAEAICAANNSAGLDTILLPGGELHFTTPESYLYGPSFLPPVVSDIIVMGNGTWLVADAPGR